MKTQANKLLELKKNFQEGKIIKASYIKKMHHLHQRLFEYVPFIKTTDISQIEISEAGVIATAKEGDLKIFCDGEDHRIAPLEILNFDHYEKEEFELALALIGKKATIFDIGANIGWYSLLLAKKLKNSRVLAFEPIQKTFRYLEKNISLNRVKNVQAYNFGFSWQKEKKVFYYYPQGSGNASLANLAHHPSSQKITCRLETIDDFSRKRKVKIDFIKCDVEGSELFVFQGGVTTLKEDQPIILVEMLRKWEKAFGYQPNQLINFLKDLGYDCFVAKGRRLKKITEINQETKETNFFFLHRQKHQKEIARLTI